jgi:hypothetical protein
LREVSFGGLALGPAPELVRVNSDLGPDVDGAKLAAADLSPHGRARHLRQLGNLIQRQERGGGCWCGLSSHEHQ